MFLTAMYPVIKPVSGKAVIGSVSVYDDKYKISVISHFAESMCLI